MLTGGVSCCCLSCALREGMLVCTAVKYVGVGCKGQGFGICLGQPNMLGGLWLNGISPKVLMEGGVVGSVAEWFRPQSLD